MRKMPARRFLWICACAFISVSVHAQLSLGSAVDLALRNSTAVKIAEADRAHAAASLSEVKDAYIPALVFGSGLAYTNGFPIGDPSVARLSAQSLIFNFSQHDNVRAARAALESSSLGVEEQRQQIILDTALTYTELAVTQDAVRALAQQESDANDLVTQMQDRQRAGVESALEVKRAQLRAAQTRLKRLNLSSRAVELRQHLSGLTGFPVANMALDIASLPAFPATSPEDDATLPGLAIANSVSLKQAERQRAQKEFEYFAEKRINWRPEIDFVAQYGYFSNINNYSSYYQHFTNSNAAIGVQITIPLFNRINNDHAHEARADADKAGFQVEAMRDQVKEATVTFERSVNQTAAAEDVARLQQEIAQADAQALQTQATNGSAQPGAPPITPQQVTQARLNAGSLEADYLAARFEHIKAELNLLKQTGGLEAWAKSSLATSTSTHP